MGAWNKFLDIVVVGAAQSLVERVFQRKPTKPKPIPTAPTTPKVPEEPEALEPVGGVVGGEVLPEFSTVAEIKRSLKFGVSSGLLVKPSDHGGIVVLMPIGIRAKHVMLEGPRGSLSLQDAGFANPHRGIERQHWRDRSADVEKLQRELGRVGKVSLVVDGASVLLPKKLSERME